MTITITWAAFGEPTSATLDFTPPVDDKTALEDMYAATNTYGEIQPVLWSLIEPVLPTSRSHTALSIGDLVTIDGRTYRCAPIGWEEVA